MYAGGAMLLHRRVFSTAVVLGGEFAARLVGSIAPRMRDCPNEPRSWLMMVWRPSPLVAL